MRIKSSNSIDRSKAVDYLMIAALIVYSFYYLNPYFVWDTFAGGIFGSFKGLIPYRTLAGLLFILLWIIKYTYSGLVISSTQIIECLLVIAVGFVLICLPVNAGFDEIISFAWLPYIAVSLTLLLPKQIQTTAYTWFITLYAISLICPLVFYVLNHLGIPVPYVRLESAEAIKVIRGRYYKLYPFAVQLTSELDPEWQELRLTGIFDEAGRLGTLSGLFLASEKLKITKNWKNIIIFTAGVLSFSMAFYLLLIIYAMTSLLLKKPHYTVALLFAGIVCYIVFINLRFNNPALTRFQERFLFFKSDYSVNNREDIAFMRIMRQFDKSDLHALAFGFGDGAVGVIQDAKNIDSSSYRVLIYNYGYIGFMGIICWYMIYAVLETISERKAISGIIPLVLVYLANMYQRPSSFYLGYMLILIGGVAACGNKKTYQR